LLAAAAGFGARIWTLTDGKDLAHLEGMRAYSLAVAFAPDGKTVASCGEDKLLSIWEIATGQERMQLGGHLGSTRDLAFTADGRTLASASEDTTVLVWDVTCGLRCGRPARWRPSLADLDSAWKAMAGADAAQAHAGIWTLIAAGAEGTAFLRKHFLPIPKASDQRLRQLVRDLDHDRFAQRQQASDELARYGDLAWPILERTLARQPSPEVRKRIEELLPRERWPLRPGELLRGLRSLEVLEQLGTPDACHVLKDIAAGASEATLTQEAQQSLSRLKQRQP
jgi:hypothetical protein